MRNFNDPETSLAGLEHRNATDASLQMEDHNAEMLLHHT